MVTVAALFVDARGVYANLPGVEVWDEARDARMYAGPWPVVAHPPCATWCRLAGWVEARGGAKRGEDGGCFEAALAAVHRFGGVIEHPAYSKAWSAHGLPAPITRWGWTGSLLGGWSCYVEQGRYGHPVKKATWLYAYGVELADLRWGFTADTDHGRRLWTHRWTGAGATSLPRQWRSRSPEAFRDALLSLASQRSDGPEGPPRKANRSAVNDSQGKPST